MADLIDEFFVRPMQYPTQYAPYNIYNTAAYAIIALICAYLIYKWLISKKIPIDAAFYSAIVPFIFFGGILRVVQDAGILPRSLAILGITIYPFITPGIYVLVTIILAAVFYLSNQYAKGNIPIALKRTRDSGIGLSLALFSILALLGFSKINAQSAFHFALILALSFGALIIFELIKSRIYDAHKKADMKNLERTALFSQMLDGSATFIAVNFSNYSEQHLLANGIFDFFGTPFAFYVIKLIFSLAIIFVLRKEAQSKTEHVFVLTLVTVFGLAPGLRDALRLLFSV